MASGIGLSERQNRAPGGGPPQYSRLAQDEASFQLHDLRSFNPYPKDDQTFLQVRGWPTRPRKLRYCSSVLSFLGDVVLTAIPLLFLALAIAAFTLKDRPTGGTFGLRVEAASKLGPTIFPIAFAAVVGRALKSIGRFRAERGIKLSTLKSLTSSKSIFDALASQLQLGGLTVITAYLVLLWSLSPIGGQASLRVLGKSNQTAVTVTPLRYMDTGPAGHVYASEWTLQGNDGATPPSIDSAYEAALMQGVSTKTGPEDAWGNVKIPRIEHLNTTQPGAEGWIPVSSLGDVELYSSLFGLPVVGLPQDGTSEFTVETSYVSLSCRNVQDVNADPGDTPGDGFKARCLTCLSTRGSVAEAVKANGTIILARVENFLAVKSLNSTENSHPIYSDAHVLRLTSSDVTTNSSKISAVDCVPTQTLVETMISCKQGSCEATKVRPSTTDHRPANYSVFDYWGHYVLERLSEVGHSKYGYSSASEFFMNSSAVLPIASGNLVGGGGSFVDILTLPSQQFADRAAILLNTYIQVFMSATGFSGNLPNNMSLYGPDHIPATGLDSDKSFFLSANSTWFPECGNAPHHILDLGEALAPFVGASTTANVTRSTEVYKPDIVWIIILFVSSGILICTGIVGIVLGCFTLAPDIFDPVAGLTYDNPYIRAPRGGSTLDATERVKLLGDVEVRIGDVSGNQEIGKVALATGGDVQPLRSGKLYL